MVEIDWTVYQITAKIFHMTAFENVMKRNLKFKVTFCLLQKLRCNKLFHNLRTDEPLVMTCLWSSTECLIRGTVEIPKVEISITRKFRGLNPERSKYYSIGLLLIKGEDRTIRVHFEISKSRSLKKTHKGKCIASKLSTIRQIACLQTLKQIWLSTERKIGQHVTPTHLPCPLKHI
ncbi:hypothetical protein M514_05919 [Trichuris suis]|uniref:Uncharacterized protein n=1 Tax=Trichuris suis TaxID=68888 RepID=A0A085N7Y4_9BILA|nr:hypothetical protein M514_05919 [Trichuris suis]